MKNLLIVILICSVMFAVFLLIYQSKLIYHPQRYFNVGYTPTENSYFLNYATSQGNQIAFFYPPQEPTHSNIPERVWIIFSGNASLALNWLDFVKRFPDKHAAFLLIDYPGYGRCSGKPSPTTIEESTEAAFRELQKKMQELYHTNTFRIGILGHSLGAAAALNFANFLKDTPAAADTLILVSPFTSMKDMARRAVGWIFSNVLLHRFDNRHSLRELMESKRPPKVTIIHGSLDEVIPVTMGKELAGLFPQMITYKEYAGHSHNSVLEGAEGYLFDIMRDAGAPVR